MEGCGEVGGNPGKSMLCKRLSIVMKALYEMNIALIILGNGICSEIGINCLGPLGFSSCFQDYCV